MNEQLAAAVKFIDEKTQRERMVILLLSVVLVYGLCDLLFLGALLEDKNNKAKALAALESSNSQIQLQIDNVSVLQQANSLTQTAEHEQLENKLQNIEQRLASVATGFIPANRMAGVLEEVLASQDQLKLLALENIPVVALTTSAAGENKAALFRHGVKIELQGSYRSALDYLQTLESLSWQFDWSTLSFEVTEYPSGKLTLEVLTYSTDKQWLGV